MTDSPTPANANIAEVVETFQRWLWLPDPGIVLVVLALIAANRMSGLPLWLLVVGPPSSGKTEVLDALGLLPDTHAVSAFSEPGLISGSPVRKDDQQAKGGLLIHLGKQGVLVFKDFTTVLSEQPATRNRLFACLREVYDGAYTRWLGTNGGQEFKWKGKAGLIGAVTQAIDTVDLGLLGERFCYYRLPGLDEGGTYLAGLTALKNVGDEEEMRAELSATVASFIGS